jgi:hypothetical protein
MYFGSEQLELNLYLNPVNRFAFGTPFVYTGSPNTTNPASINGGGVGAANSVLYTTLTGTTTFSNLAIYLNTEQDAKIIEGLVGKTMSTGYSINFAYPLITRQNLSGTNQSVNTQLTRGYGKSLLFIGTSFYNGSTWNPPNNTQGTGTNGVAWSNAETLNSAQDHSLYNLLTNSAQQTGAFNYVAGSTNTYCGTGAFVGFLYTAQIDSINILTNNQYNPYLGEHWLYNKEHLAGSAIKSINEYNVEFVHIDNFCTDPICMLDQTVDDGLSLENYRQHQMTFTATANNGASGMLSSTAPSVNWYCIYICQRTLNLSSQGLLVT